MGDIDSIIRKLGGLDAGELAKLEQEVDGRLKDFLWAPNPGPQTDAYFTEADETLYGGEAGGGKSDLLAGLSLTQHHRSLVLRRTNKEAEKLIERYKEIIGHTNGLNEQRGVWRLQNRIIDIQGCQLEKDKQKFKGTPHDLIGFDEVVDFTESQYEFIIQWNRTNRPGQRCRVVATTNPPTKPEGMWVVKRWAAWLDDKHPKPAKSGEIRWYTTGPDGEDMEVEGPGPHEVNGRKQYAKSRTFIRAKLADNPDLTRTNDYQARLDAAPLELRAAYRDGDFTARLEDQPMQCIPTEWIRMAQERWTNTPPNGVPQCAIGVDASGGGKDPMVLAIRHDGWYAPLVRVPGADLPQDRLGAHSAGVIISYRRNHSKVIIDMGGGYGGSIFEKCRENEIDAFPYKGAEASVRRTKDGQYRFINKRTEAYWKFREALDPSQAGGSPICLPPEPRLLAELAAPTFEVTAHGIKLESKDDVKAKLGHSPDEADAVVMAWFDGPNHITHGGQWADAAKESGMRGTRPRVVMGRENARRYR